MDGVQNPSGEQDLISEMKQKHLLNPRIGGLGGFSALASQIRKLRPVKFLKAEK